MVYLWTVAYPCKVAPMAKFKYALNDLNIKCRESFTKDEP